jgi:hypothetical protein
VAHSSSKNSGSSENIVFFIFATNRFGVNEKTVDFEGLSIGIYSVTAVQTNPFCK